MPQNEAGWRPRESAFAFPEAEVEPLLAAPSVTPSEALPPAGESSEPPELPDITLSPTPLHRGSFADVYRGWDRVHRCDVIVKVQRGTDSAVAADRFRREAAVMGRLRHPNIVALYRFYGGDPAALVMEYVPGQTLAKLVGAHGWLPPPRVASLIDAVSAALDCAHAQGIVHRDVKPSNILIPRRGAARVSDFGVAHVEDDTSLTVMGDVLGTIEYASPEQVHGHERPDSRSDVYSLAAVAYFALTGTPPFRAADNSAQAQLSVMHRQVFADPPPLRLHRPNLSPEIETVVLRGLAKAPEARYQSAGQFAAALRGAIEAGSGAPEGRAMAASSHRTGALAGALAGAALLLLAAGWWRVNHVEPPAPAPARAALHFPPHPAPVSVVPMVHLPAAAPVRTALPPPAPSAKPVPQPRPPQTVSVVQTMTPLKKTIASRRLLVIPPPVLALPRMHPEPPVSAALGAAAAPEQAWLSVYAKQNTAPLGQTPRTAGIHAQAVYVDGRLVPALAAGQWAALPAGKHVLSFFPEPRSGFSPHTGVTVTLAPRAHVSRQILLPVQTNAAPETVAVRPLPVAALGTGWVYVYGVRTVNAPGQPREIVRIPALSVAVDGKPVPELTGGHWARLPAGNHVLTFVPQPGLEAGPGSLTFSLSPQSHLLKQLPLPSVPPLHLRNP